MADSNKGNKEYTVIIAQVPPSKKRKTYYGWMKEEVCLSHFCKVGLAPTLAFIAVPEAFIQQLGQLPAKIRLETNTSCVRTMDLTETNGRACIERLGAICVGSRHPQSYQLLFQKFAPQTFKVFIFDTTGVEIVKMCPPHPDNLWMD